jgi:hypothetical protein
MSRARYRLDADERWDYYCDWCEDRDLDPQDRDSESSFDDWVDNGGN